MAVLETVQSLFISYGYYFLFFATALENIPVIGAFMPGEVIVVAAGFTAASGELELSKVILIATGGAFIGSNISYLMGRWGGRALIERIAKRLRMDGDRLDAADRYFSNHGPITVFVGRYMSGIKAFIPALAGAHHMPFGRFLVFSSLGIITWTIAASLLGFYFGQNWGALMRVFKAVGWLIPAVILLGALALVYFRRRRPGSKRD